MNTWQAMEYQTTTSAWKMFLCIWDLWGGGKRRLREAQLSLLDISCLLAHCQVPACRPGGDPEHPPVLALDCLCPLTSQAHCHLLSALAAEPKVVLEGGGATCTDARRHVPGQLGAEGSGR